MIKADKHKHNQITEEEFNKHKSQGIYLRDDYCDWGSSGLNEYDNNLSNTEKNS